MFVQTKRRAQPMAATIPPMATAGCLCIAALVAAGAAVVEAAVLPPLVWAPAVLPVASVFVDVEEEVTVEVSLADCAPALDPDSWLRAEE